MERILVFAKRNFKEIVRDPLSLIFNFIFPIAMLLLFMCFILGKDEETIKAQMPMFNPNQIIPAVAIFGFSFLTLFSGMLVAKDRESSLTDRLRISPLKPYEFFLGYAIPMFLVAFIQWIIVYSVGFLLSLLTSITFNLLSLGTIIAFFVDIPIMIFFISFGIFLGSFINNKAIGGASSILVNISAITSGMFMPLATMGVFKNVCQVFPFVHAVSLAQYATSLSWPNNVNYFNNIIEEYQSIGITVQYSIFDTWWMNLIIVVFYTVIIVILSILMFNKKLSSDKK